MWWQIEVWDISGVLLVYNIEQELYDFLNMKVFLMTTDNFPNDLIVITYYSSFFTFTEKKRINNYL